jgi:hypothetical protein
VGGFAKTKALAFYCPKSGDLGRGAQSLGQSCLVLSQASGARHLRGSGQWGLQPNFKASGGKGTIAGSWGWGTGQSEQAGARDSNACS